MSNKSRVHDCSDVFGLSITKLANHFVKENNIQDENTRKLVRIAFLTGAKFGCDKLMLAIDSFPIYDEVKKQATLLEDLSDALYDDMDSILISKFKKGKKHE